MRGALLFLFLAAAVSLNAQDPAKTPQPLGFSDAIALQLSKAQVMKSAMSAWEYSFGQQPGARILATDSANGRIEGAARVNFRSSTLGAREATLGVIAYRITLEARNGQCLVRVSQVEHTGNRTATGGGVDLGTIYADDRPATPIPGISMGTARRLHEDMRNQATVKIQTTMRAFASKLRALAAP